MMNSVSRVEKVSPPITAIPIGCHVSDPTPVPIASGSIPRMVVNEVMSTGRRRLFPPAITASKTPEPRSTSRFM